MYGGNGNDILFGGNVTASDPGTDSLQKVLADYIPATNGVYVGLRQRPVVTEDYASSDRLEGDAGTDWFWSVAVSDVISDPTAGGQKN